MAEVCTAFDCRPSEALFEMENHIGLVFSVASLRAYAKAKAIFDQAKSAEDVPKGPLFAEVAENEYWLVKAVAEERAKQRDAERRDHRSDPETA